MDFVEAVLNIFKDALQLGLIWSIMCLGIFISFRVLDFADLTAEGSVTLGSAVTAALMLLKDVDPFFVHPLFATFMAIISGFVFGMITGILHTKLKIPGILAGIITMTGLFTINLKIMGKASLYLGDVDTVYSYIDKLIDNSFFSKTIMALIFVCLMFFILYWFFGTEIGMSVRATGMNQKMSRAQGINTNAMIILGLGISNALIALSGSLFMQSQRSANMDVGRGAIVLGLASIIIGEVIFGKRSFKNWMISVILGSIVFQAIIGVALQLGMDANYLKLLQAILTALILGFPVFKKYMVSKRNGVANHA